MSVDSKLVHLVRKFLSFSVDDSPKAEHIVHCLRAQHREYQRKDLARLKRQVQRVLKHLAMQEEVAGSTAKKRSLEQAEEDNYDKKACDHDIQRSMELNDSSVLNANLRDQYRRLQQERDYEARSEAAEEARLLMEEPPVEAERESKKEGKSKSPSRDISSSNERGEEASVKSSSNANTKSLKRKKPGSKRSSSGDILDGLGSPSAASFSPAAADDKAEAGLTLFAKTVRRPTERYSDLGGMEDILNEIRQLVEYPLVRPELYRHLGVDPPRGVLLQGPPGCGKTHLANAIAGQLGVPYFRVSAPELVSGMSGESEGRIRDLFQAASDSAPAIIFLDELDAIAPKRNDGGSGRGMEKRMVAQLLTSMDSLDPKFNRSNAPVIVLGATNRSDSIDPALRRAGRFDREILLGVPDEEARLGIIKTMTKGMKLSGDFDYKVLARKTPGYVGADVRSLTKEAAVLAINRIFKDVLKEQNSQDLMAIEGSENNGNADSKYSRDISAAISPLTMEQMEPLMITMDDFLAAIPLVQPSSKREGFATVPDVSWDDIGALGSIREELTLSVLEPIRNPEKFQALGIPLPAGVMLYGPPGCGKTLLAKAIANESGANFISVKGPELLDKYVGESERAVRLVFERARSSSPCIVFFDEMDSLCPKRGGDGGGGGGVSERVVNQLLTEMDGLDSRRSVFVIAATNRPELIDPAMMRPGRLDKLLYVPLPTADDRVAILEALSECVKLGPDVDLKEIGRSHRADGYSGADCAALLREAGLSVLKEDIGKYTNGKLDSIDTSRLCITKHHFNYAFDHVVPSVSKKDQARYDRIRDRMAHARTRGGVIDAPQTEEIVVVEDKMMTMDDAATPEVVAVEEAEGSQEGSQMTEPPAEVAKSKLDILENVAPPKPSIPAVVPVMNGSPSTPTTALIPVPPPPKPMSGTVASSSAPAPTHGP